MYIKIYFDDKPLFLCDEIEASLQPYLHHDDAVFIDELNTHAVKSMIHEMQQPQVHFGIYFHKDFEELKKAFFKKFTLVQAAGGFVLNEKGEVLLMFRRSKWDLPKGKQDKKETAADCAIRETEEETGYRISAIKKIFEAYMSPGSVTEILYFFIAEYSKTMKVNEGGGIEQEDIEVIELNFDTALKMIDTGEIKDGKTIMLLQYLRLKNIL